MKLLFKTFLLLIIIFIFENSVYSLSDFQIRQICQKKSKRSACIKNLKFKKLNLLKGHQIEIPVVPYKK